MRHRIGKVAVALFTTGMLGAGAFAFTNANSVPVSYAGAGTAAVNGYVVSGITYGLSPHGHFIKMVTFDLNNPATTVDAALDPPPPPPPGGPGGPVWLHCGPVGAGPSFQVTCSAPGPGPGVPTIGTDSLEINAAQ
ncbi:MAG: hypothetical protein ACYDHP_10845 [Ferrimicrobium sp.]